MKCKDLCYGAVKIAGVRFKRHIGYYDNDEGWPPKALVYFSDLFISDKYFLGSLTF